jgi:tRNA(Ile)-lysidine synthase
VTRHPLRLRHRVGEGIARHALWAPGDRVAVAVSGGLDSAVLLDVLVATRGWHRAALEVVTVDHGLHGASAEHAAGVAGLAASLGLRCTVARVELDRGADEAAARAARYAALDALPVDRVALAHHADDVAETVLVNLLRGTGAAGLAGIPRRRGRYVRPLLDEDRASLRAWAEARGLRWVDDPTNADPRFLRNRIRAEVVPLLDSLRPGAARAVARSAGTVRRDVDLLDALAAGAPGAQGPDRWPLGFVTGAPEPIVRRALGVAAPGIGPRAVAAVIRAAERGSGRVPVHGGAFVATASGVSWQAGTAESEGPTARCSG